MRVKEAYRDVTHEVCREHYRKPPENAPPLGRVEDSRDGQCEFCDASGYTMDEAERHALADVVNHYFADEERHYCESPSERHVYLALERLGKWLSEGSGRTTR